MSLSEVAFVLGVSRQAVSLWENGKKEIPLKRKEELGEYFGINPDYFGEISEEVRQLLLKKAMFRYELNGKEIYRYCHEDDVDKVYFLPDLEEPLDEKAFQAKKRKKDTIQMIEQMIDHGGFAGIEERSNIINLGCRDYEYTTSLLKMVQTQPLLHKVPMRLELESVWMAMEMAYGVMDEGELQKEADLNPYLDLDFIKSVAENLKKHWGERQQELEEKNARFEERKVVLVEKSNKEKQGKSLDERIREAEKDYSRLENRPGGTMVYFL